MSRRGITAIVAVVVGLLGAGSLLMWLRVLSDPGHLPGADWRLYKKLFVRSDGRVVDTGNGNITHSEGQAYAMILAEAWGDRQTFDRIWNWTRDNLQTRPDDKLLSWLWKPAPDGEGGAVADPNNASDGEILAAWALTRAARRWNHYPYEQAAATMLLDLRRLAVKSTPDGPILLPGVMGFVKDDGVILNPSYYVFPALTELGRTFPGGGWDLLGSAGKTLLAKARFGSAQLNPDWLLDGEGYSLKTHFPPDFGYNAIRIPLHVAWENPSSELLAPYLNFWRAFPDLSKMPATVNLETNSFGPDPALPGMQAVAQFTLGAGLGNRMTVRDIPALTREEPYYSASLKLLTKVAVRDAMGASE